MSIKNIFKLTSLIFDWIWCLVYVDLWVGNNSQQYRENLIAETTTNVDVKVRVGPMHGGYSTSERKTDNFIKTSHMMAAIREKLNKKLWYMTSSAQKEVSPGSWSKHENTVWDLTNQLQKLLDPSLQVPDRNFKSRVQIVEIIVDGLLKSQTAGECLLKVLIEDRINAPRQARPRQTFSTLFH